jgi:hypothetical protein
MDGVRFPAEARDFSLFHNIQTSSTVQLASHLVGSGYQGVLSPRVKRPGLEADNSPPSNVVVKNDEAIVLLSYTSSWRDA